MPTINPPPLPGFQPKLKLACALLFIALLSAFASRSGAALSPVDLRCDYAVNPLGVDSASPRLFWKLEGSGRGQKQSAYQILAATTAAVIT